MSALLTALDRICGEKKKQVAETKGRRSLQEMLKRAQDQAPPRGFIANLEKSIETRGIALIAEIKKASPSAGVIRKDFQPTQLARSYHRGGAACLSVLTDQKFFQGSEADLGEARLSCDMPVLRKDFMIDPYQIIESRALGSDCVLLIVAALTDAELSQFEDIALGYQMDVLVEVHDEAELERALKLKSRLIGVNGTLSPADPRRSIAGIGKRHRQPGGCKAPCRCGSQSVSDWRSSVAPPRR